MYVYEALNFVTYNMECTSTNYMLIRFFEDVLNLNLINKFESDFMFGVI